MPYFDLVLGIAMIELAAKLAPPYLEYEDSSSGVGMRTHKFGQIVWYGRRNDRYGREQGKLMIELGMSFIGKVLSSC